MAIQPVLGGSQLPLVHGTNIAPRAQTDVALTQIAVQAQGQTVRRALEQAADNAPDTMNGFDASAAYDMHARVEPSVRDRRGGRGSLIDRRA